MTTRNRALAVGLLLCLVAAVYYRDSMWTPTALAPQGLKLAPGMDLDQVAILRIRDGQGATWYRPVGNFVGARFNSKSVELQFTSPEETITLTNAEAIDSAQRWMEYIRSDFGVAMGPGEYPPTVVPDMDLVKALGVLDTKHWELRRVGGTQPMVTEIAIGNQPAKIVAGGLTAVEAVKNAAATVKVDNIPQLEPEDVK